ncbi:MAG: DUF6752 domain-containing protein [Jatrophihabitans sp.]|uniref:DUF6752 domain-containing protein n=1 Tax=Jatrophihabitans sp. TaxID=1932789 RepID=UPI003F7E3312
MAALSSRLQAGGRRVARAVAPSVIDSAAAVRGLTERLDRQADRLDRQRERLDRQRDEIDGLRGRVAELEREIQESRRLQQRVAELTDIVAEVLIPAADRDDEKIKQILDGYARVSF